MIWRGGGGRRPILCFFYCFPNSSCIAGQFLFLLWTRCMATLGGEASQRDQICRYNQWSSKFSEFPHFSCQAKIHVQLKVSNFFKFFRYTFLTNSNFFLVEYRYFLFCQLCWFWRWKEELNFVQSFTSNSRNHCWLLLSLFAKMQQFDKYELWKHRKIHLPNSAL